MNETLQIIVLKDIGFKYVKNLVLVFSQGVGKNHIF